MSKNNLKLISIGFIGFFLFVLLVFYSYIFSAFYEFYYEESVQNTIKKMVKEGCLN